MQVDGSKKYEYLTESNYANFSTKYISDYNNSAILQAIFDGTYMSVAQITLRLILESSQSKFCT